GISYSLALLVSEKKNIHLWKKKSYYEPFLSKVTLNGLRVTILSTVDIVGLLLKENYKYVLTGKLNQDCIERFFGIIRMSGRCGDKPTMTSFLELFRLLTLYYPTKQFLRGSNCEEEEEKSEVLTSYHTWMKINFNNNKKEMKEKKEYFRDILLKGIEREINLSNVAAINSEEDSTSLNLDESKMNILDCDIMYYICGYLVHSYRKKGKTTNSSFCKHCLESVDVSPEELPPKFSAAQLTKIKKKGKLIFASSTMFQLICKVKEAF
ncbi:Uncharacterized protein APZ42_000608, partial [Daphnia magna]